MFRQDPIKGRNIILIGRVPVTRHPGRMRVFFARYVRVRFRSVDTRGYEPDGQISLRLLCQRDSIELTLRCLPTCRWQTDPRQLG